MKSQKIIIVIHLFVFSFVLGQVITDNYTYSVTLNNNVYENGDTVVAIMEMSNISGDTIQFYCPWWFDWMHINPQGIPINGLAFIPIDMLFTINPQESLIDTFIQILDYIPEDSTESGTHYWLMKPFYNYDTDPWDSASFYYRLNLSTTDEEVILNDFKISDIYPNPANPSFIVSFELFNTADARITVLNTLGKEIEIILDGYYQKGVHQLQWNGNNYSSGVYIIRYEINGISSLKKLTIIK